MKDIKKMEEMGGMLVGHTEMIEMQEETSKRMDVSIPDLEAILHSWFV